MKQQHLVIGFMLVLILIPLSLVSAQDEFSLPDDLQPLTLDNIEDLAQVATLEPAGSGISALALSADGSLLAYAAYDDEYRIHVLDLNTGDDTVIEEYTTMVSGLAFNPEKTFLASVTSDENEVIVWEIESGEVVANLTSPVACRKLAFSADGTMLGAAGGAGDAPAITVWDTATWEENYVLEGVFISLAISTDGSFVASTEYDGTAVVFDSVSGDEVISLEGHVGLVSGIALNSENTLLATGGDDNTIRLWEIESGDEMHVIEEAYEGGINTLAFNPDGSLLASLGEGIIMTVSGNNISFQFASGDQIVRFWDVETGDEVSAIREDSGNVGQMIFNAEWTIMVLADLEGITFWGVPG